MQKSSVPKGGKVSEAVCQVMHYYPLVYIDGHRFALSVLVVGRLCTYASTPLATHTSLHTSTNSPSISVIHTPSPSLLSLHSHTHTSSPTILTPTSSPSYTHLHPRLHTFTLTPTPSPSHPHVHPDQPSQLYTSGHLCAMCDADRGYGITMDLTRCTRECSAGGAILFVLICEWLLLPHLTMQPALLSAVSSPSCP